MGGRNRNRSVSLILVLAINLVFAAQTTTLATARSNVRTWKSHGYFYVAKKATAGYFRQERGTATCPRGTSLRGGGMNITGDYAAAVTIASTEVSGPHTWLAYAQNEGPLTQKTTTFAICHKEVAEIIASSPPTSIPVSGGQAQATALCSSGNTVVGGGVHAYNGFYSTHVDVNMSIPVDGDLDTVPDNGWLGYANNRGPYAETMQTIAICDTTSKMYIQTSNKPLPALTQDTIQASCPAGTVVTSGGGFNNSTDPNVAISSSGPYDSSDVGSAPDNGWQSSVRNGSASPITIRGYAVCVTVV